MSDRSLTEELDRFDFATATNEDAERLARVFGRALHSDLAMRTGVFDQEHPIGVDESCPKCGALTIATHPFEHCWKCGNRQWPQLGDEIPFSMATDEGQRELIQQIENRIAGMFEDVNAALAMQAERTELALAGALPTMVATQFGAAPREFVENANWVARDGVFYPPDEMPIPEAEIVPPEGE